MKIKIIVLIVCILQVTCVFAQEQDFSAIFSMLQNMDFSDTGESENEENDVFFENLMSGLIESEDEVEVAEQDTNDLEKKHVEIDFEKSKEAFGKFNEHVSTYFQKVYVVRENFFLI